MFFPDEVQAAFRPNFGQHLKRLVRKIDHEIQGVHISPEIFRQQRSFEIAMVTVGVLHELNLVGSIHKTGFAVDVQQRGGWPEAGVESVGEFDGAGFS
ncbi:hypothetical protein [Phnomibacter ginsenosidimutans]|uniref:hypothetical protein n=1 Tax=Phnomibacter ginsenosidimutans TaxID=2676868 RepID=UPI0018D27279|nr:hypothetical protein [Phnomibacter ginsenosidimutans]